LRLPVSPSGEKSLVMTETTKRVALGTLVVVVIAIVAAALALWKLKLVIALVASASSSPPPRAPGSSAIARSTGSRRSYPGRSASVTPGI
jgi:hypothetical protein